MVECSLALEALHRRGMEGVCGIVNLLSSTSLVMDHVDGLVDVAVYHGSLEAAMDAVDGLGVVLEAALVPNLRSRAVWLRGLPHISLEDAVASVVVNEDKPWYMELVGKLVSRVCAWLDWEWILEVLARYGYLGRFKALLGSPWNCVQRSWQ